MARRSTVSNLSVITVAATLAAACASTPPREALPQVSKVGDPPITWAGSYDVENNRLTLTANDQPVMRGSFPPFTPVMNLDGTFEDSSIRAECYFASVLNEQGGLFGAISTAVQSKNAKTSDTCKMMVNAEEAATLNF